MNFPGLEKSWNLGNMAEVMENRGISFFDPNISRCLKTRNILIVMGRKYAQKRLGFQFFLVMENSNWSWKSP